MQDKMMQEKVKALWKLCFDDSDEFTDMYFRLRYSDDANIAIQSDGEVIAALQMLSYPMTFGTEEIGTGYISGACTHPAYRNRGTMRQLLLQAFARMLHNGMAVSTLIPAEPWLFGYYAGMGYAPVFKYAPTSFTVAEAVASHDTVTETAVPHDAVALNKTDGCQEAAYRYLNRKLHERPCCIQHTEADFQVILADLQLCKGWVYTLNRGDGKITALAVVYPAGNTWQAGEVVADTPDMRSLLLQRICRQLNIPSIQVIAPATANLHAQALGMARILDAKTVLQLHAAGHPELEMSIALTDPQINANNGYYYLSNGTCTNSAKRLTSSHLALTIGELAEKILSPSSPYMSLMLN